MSRAGSGGISGIGRIGRIGNVGRGVPYTAKSLGLKTMKGLQDQIPSNIDIETIQRYLPGGQRLVTDEASGFAILPRPKRPKIPGLPSLEQ